MKLGKKRQTILKILSRVDALKSLDDNMVLWPYICYDNAGLFITLDKTSYMNIKLFLCFTLDKNL